MNIQGSVALITGAASGMGAETARYLAQRGAQLIVLDRELSKAQQIADELQGLAIECDVSSSEQTEAAIAAATKAKGAIDICVNCAGIAPAARIVSREGAMPLADFQQVITVNLIGTFNVLRLVAAQMMQQQPSNDDDERGVIINTASVAAFEGQIGQAAYSASKGGVAALTLPAAREFGRWGIRVMTIAPGVMATPMMAGMSDEVQQHLQETVTFPKRLGHANEYAALVAHIVENAYLNGEVIRLDGALRMGSK